MKELKAKNVFIYATHGIFSGEGFYDRLEASALARVFVSDSLLPVDPAREKASKVTRLSMAPLIVDAIEKSF